MPTREIFSLKELITQATIQQSISDLNDDVTKDVSEGLGNLCVRSGHYN